MEGNKPEAIHKADSTLPKKWEGQPIFDRPSSDEELEAMEPGTLIRETDGRIIKYLGSIPGGKDGKNVHQFELSSGGKEWENLNPSGT